MKIRSYLSSRLLAVVLLQVVYFVGCKMSALANLLFVDHGCIILPSFSVVALLAVGRINHSLSGEIEFSEWEVATAAAAVPCLWYLGHGSSSFLWIVMDDKKYMVVRFRG